MSIKILQLHKRSAGLYNHIQDKFAYKLDTNCYALADGATQSFNAEYWAELITAHFINNPTFEYQKIIDGFNFCAQKFHNSDFKLSDDPGINFLDREMLKVGASSTFLGIQFSPGLLKVISCGDTNLFLIRDDQITGFPANNSTEINQCSQFLNTRRFLENKVSQDNFIVKDFETHQGDVIILATDALSRLLLDDLDTHHELAAVDNFEELLAFCTKFWSDYRLEEDDISAIIIRIDNSQTTFEIIPPDDFQFEESLPATLLNTPEISENIPHMANNDLKELEQNTLQLATKIQSLEDFQRSLQKKLWLIIILLVISLVLMVFLILYHVRLDQKISKSPIQTHNNKSIENTSKTNSATITSTEQIEPQKPTPE